MWVRAHPVPSASQSQHVQPPARVPVRQTYNPQRGLHFLLTLGLGVARTQGFPELARSAPEGVNLASRINVQS